MFIWLNLVIPQHSPSSIGEVALKTCNIARVSQLTLTQYGVTCSILTPYIELNQPGWLKITGWDKWHSWILLHRPVTLRNVAPPAFSSVISDNPPKCIIFIQLSLKSQGNMKVHFKLIFSTLRIFFFIIKNSLLLTLHCNTYFFHLDSIENSEENKRKAQEQMQFKPLSRACLNGIYIIQALVLETNVPLCALACFETSVHV